MPADIKESLGLDQEKSWVCLEELNVFRWPGYDLRPIGKSGRYYYGALPEAFFEQVRQGVLALHRARKAKQILRD